MISTNLNAKSTVQEDCELENRFKGLRTYPCSEKKGIGDSHLAPVKVITVLKVNGGTMVIIVKQLKTGSIGGEKTWGFRAGYSKNQYDI
jgi:hypothetical protein